MSTSLKIVSIIIMSLYFVTIFSLLRRKKIALKYSLLWIFSGIIMIIFILFPQILIFGAQLIGIEIASNGLFAICIFFIVLLLVSLTVIVSGLKYKEKQLIQNLAILEKRVRTLEKNKAEGE